MRPYITKRPTKQQPQTMAQLQMNKMLLVFEFVKMNNCIAANEHTFAIGTFEHLQMNKIVLLFQSVQT
jgi:hypothetical protein